MVVTGFFAQCYHMLHCSGFISVGSNLYTFNKVGTKNQYVLESSYTISLDISAGYYQIGFHSQRMLHKFTV